MTDQPEALRLADIIGGDCAVELRRLHTENERLRAALDATRDYLYDRSSLSPVDLDEMYVAAVGAKETK